MGARLLGTLDFTFEARGRIAEHREAGLALLPGVAFKVIGLAALWPSGENLGNLLIAGTKQVQGGSAETEEIALTVRPKRPARPLVVMTETPVAAAPFAKMKSAVVSAR
jgi:hypothetical protein